MKAPSYIEMSAMFLIAAFTLAGFVVQPECFYGAATVLGVWVCAIWVDKGILGG